MNIRTTYDGLQAKISDESGTSFEIKKDKSGKILNPEVVSKTVQSDQVVDINEMIKRSQAGIGIITTTARNPIYGNLMNMNSWQEVQNHIVALKNEFNNLPAEIRFKFRNDALNYLEYMRNPANTKEAIELGLRPKTELQDEKGIDNNNQEKLVPNTEAEKAKNEEKKIA